MPVTKTSGNVIGVKVDRAAERVKVTKEEKVVRKGLKHPHNQENLSRRGDNYQKLPQLPQRSCPFTALLSFPVTTSSPVLPPLPGIPTLILLDAEGHMITRQGRVEVLNDPECRLFPWHPRPVLELSESNAVQLHEGPCLVLFVGEWTCFYGCSPSSSTWGSTWSSLSVNEVAFYLEHIECQTMWKSVGKCSSIYPKTVWRSCKEAKCLRPILVKVEHDKQNRTIGHQKES